VLLVASLHEMVTHIFVTGLPPALFALSRRVFHVRVLAPKTHDSWTWGPSLVWVAALAVNNCVCVCVCVRARARRSGMPSRRGDHVYGTRACSLRSLSASPIAFRMMMMSIGFYSRNGRWPDPKSS